MGDNLVQVFDGDFGVDFFKVFQLCFEIIFFKSVYFQLLFCFGYFKGGSFKDGFVGVVCDFDGEFVDGIGMYYVIVKKGECVVQVFYKSRVFCCCVIVKEVYVKLDDVVEVIVY